MSDKMQGPDPDKLVEMIKAVTELNFKRGKNSSKAGAAIDEAIIDLMGAVSLYSKTHHVVKEVGE